MILEKMIINRFNLFPKSVLVKAYFLSLLSHFYVKVSVSLPFSIHRVIFLVGIVTDSCCNPKCDSFQQRKRILLGFGYKNNRDSSPYYRDANDHYQKLPLKISLILSFFPILLIQFPQPTLLFSYLLSYFAAIVMIMANSSHKDAAKTYRILLKIEY
jgi:hypothetical protein